jgi:hypothetical protein
MTSFVKFIRRPTNPILFMDDASDQSSLRANLGHLCSGLALHAQLRAVARACALGAVSGRPKMINSLKDFWLLEDARRLAAAAQKLAESRGFFPRWTIARWSCDQRSRCQRRSDQVLYLLRERSHRGLAPLAQLKESRKTSAICLGRHAALCGDLSCISGKGEQTTCCARLSWQLRVQLAGASGCSNEPGHPPRTASEAGA